MSLLERFMSTYFNCYERQPPDDQYDPKCVTKLLNNYRSHPEIIKVSMFCLIVQCCYVSFLISLLFFVGCFVLVCFFNTLLVTF